MTSTTIIVGIDGSPSAAAALAFATDFGRTTDASIVAIHCRQTPSGCTYPGAAWTPDEAAGEGHRLLDNALEASGATGEVRTEVRHGNPWTVLCAESQDCDLVVIGSTGVATDRGPRDQPVLGSTAQWLVERAGAPAVVVPLGATWVGDPTVVVGVDGSATSIDALRWALTSLPDSATIRVVQSVAVPATADVPAGSELLDPLVDGYRTDLEALVAETTADSGSGRRTPSSHVVLGEAHDALLDPGFAVDVIVMGRHGTTAESAKAIGSVSDHTLRHATVPVVIVPPANR